MKNLIRLCLLPLLAITTLNICAQQVPKLNSYTSASATIYLDFDGQAVSGTMWNGSGDFTCNPSGLNSTQITEVFDRVAEDYRPFNVNVTTDQTKFNQAPLGKKIRVIITTSYEWYGSGAGGVAYQYSFTWGDGTPAFVFSSLLGLSAKNIAEAASHEAGHTLGLRHQSTYTASCGKISDYNWGTGSGEIGWAPIMGAGYNQNLTLWHNGPSSIGCNALQSDLSIITSGANGFGFRTDDHTDVYSTATNATFNASQQFTISGVIEKTDDKDLFKFTVPIFSNFKLNAIPYNVGSGNSGSDLDMQIEFLDAGYNTIGYYNPGNLLSSVLDTFINAGTYYFRIDGKGNVYAPEYGSLGSYSLQGSYTDATLLAAHKIILKGQANGNRHDLSWTIESDEAIKTQELEYSYDGRNFITLTIPATSDRSYNYYITEEKPVQYRLHVGFESNGDYYSNTITMRPGKVSKPKILGNLINGSSVGVNSPDDYDYSVIDASGRTLNKGKIFKGATTLNIGNLIPGLYIVSFTNDTDQWTEKLIKQ